MALVPILITPASAMKPGEARVRSPLFPGKPGQQPGTISGAPAAPASKATALWQQYVQGAKANESLKKYDIADRYAQGAFTELKKLAHNSPARLTSAGDLKALFDFTISFESWRNRTLAANINTKPDSYHGLVSSIRNNPAPSSEEALKAYQESKQQTDKLSRKAYEESEADLAYSKELLFINETLGGSNCEAAKTARGFVELDQRARDNNYKMLPR